MTSKDTDESRAQAEAMAVVRQAWQRAQLAQVPASDPEADKSILIARTAELFGSLGYTIERCIARFGANETEVSNLLVDLAEMRKKVEAMQT